jgi:hypothetical protein
MQIQIPRQSQIPGFLQGATIQKTLPVPKTNQPELSQFTAFSKLEDGHYNRYIVDAKPQIHQGATRIATVPIPPVTTRPEYRYYLPDINRYIWEGPDQQFDGATVQPTVPIPPVSGPVLAYWQRSAANPDYLMGGLGPVPQVQQGATRQQTYIFPPNKPEFAYYWRDVNRIQRGIDETMRPLVNFGKFWSQLLSESISVSDSILRTISRALTEASTITDTILYTLSRTLSETASVADSMLRTIGRAFNDPVSVLDSIQRTASRALSETVSVTDSLLYTLARSLSETLTVSDSVSKLQARVLTETITILDHIRNFLNGLDARFSRKYPDKPGTYSEKFTSNPATYSEKYTKKGPTYTEKYPEP